MRTLYTLFVLVIYVHAILVLPLFSLPLNVWVSGLVAGIPSGIFYFLLLSLYCFV